MPMRASGLFFRRADKPPGTQTDTYMYVCKPPVLLGGGAEGAQDVEHAPLGSSEQIRDADLIRKEKIWYSVCVRIL